MNILQATVNIPEELEEKLLDVEVLLASLDERLAWRRWANRALHTSCREKQEINDYTDLLRRNGPFKMFNRNLVQVW